MLISNVCVSGITFIGNRKKMKEWKVFRSRNITKAKQNNHKSVKISPIHKGGESEFLKTVNFNNKYISNKPRECRNTHY